MFVHILTLANARLSPKRASIAKPVESLSGLMLSTDPAKKSRITPIRHRRPAPRKNPINRPGLPARLAAAQLLENVVDNRTGLDRLTDVRSGLAAWTALDERDRGLARAIALTALRHRGTIDAILRSLLDRPLPKKARHLVHTLHVGATQILYLDVPDHSAVDLGVAALSADPRSRRFAALGNALLRAIARDKASLLEKFAPAAKGLPDWLASALRTDYGRERLGRIEQAMRTEPALDLTLHPGLGNERKNEVIRALNALVLPTGSLRLKQDVAVEELPFYEDGHWWVQDAASALPARMIGDVAGKSVADLCAAPGGKTAQLAAAGAHVTAVDISPLRMERLAENLARLKLSARLVTADILDWEPEERFDAILLDAPCSATGTLRRHPDVVWTKQPEDVEALIGLQRRLIDKAARLLRPGGRLVYANCSILKAEGETLVAQILRQSREEQPTPGDLIALQREPLQPGELVGAQSLINTAGDLRTLPFELANPDPRLSGMDAFFACRFKPV